MATRAQHFFQIIDQENDQQLNWSHILSELLKSFDCSAGSIHILDPDDNTLHLKAHEGIPDFLLPKMSVIPVGKGMAGIAAMRLEPVQMCNLQTDESGVARPSAKETKVEGAMTAPMLYKGKLYGTLGIAKSVPYEFTEAETDTLLQIGSYLGQKIKEGDAQ